MTSRRQQADPRFRCVAAPASRQRLDAAREFVRSFPAGTEILLVGSSRESVDDFVRSELAHATPTFGLHRYGFVQLVAHLAATRLAEQGLAPATSLGMEAVAARATFAALQRGELPRFGPVARLPGFPRAVAATVQELRLAGVTETRDRDLDALSRHYEAALAGAGIADQAAALGLAIEGLKGPEHEILRRLPLVLLDLTLRSALEIELVAALAFASPSTFATVPAEDGATLEALARLGATRSDVREPEPATSLTQLQTHLFAGEAPPAGTTDSQVTFFSAPGEGRECIEIAREALRAAASGVPFDAMAVFLRAPEAYSTFVDTAFRRARIPAYFARGTRRPDPAGRAFLALLACGAERLSARRFAEYLSFAQVPSPQPDGAPPAPRSVWPAATAEEFGGSLATAALRARGFDPSPQLTLWDMSPFAAAAIPAHTHTLFRPAGKRKKGDAPAAVPDGQGRDAGEDAPAAEGALRAPWKWEELLVEAAVIGGRERWRRRLAGLARELELHAEALLAVEPESPRLAALRRDRLNLGHLERFALPIIDTLDSYPRGALWGEWVQQLSTLAPRVLRRPERVLAVLGEMQPMADVGPVGLDEVREVLTERLSTLEVEPPEQRYGRVFVATPEQARGRKFRCVFVPGLAERVFPQRPREDPLLLDGQRRALSPALRTQEQRVRDERLRLSLAVGAATERVVLSYPRLDAAQARPRVPSFYALDAARAVRGVLPDFRSLEREAAEHVGARLAWPAPSDPAEAIDALEHDLAVLGRWVHADDSRAGKGRARYLLELNPHLARSLRARFQRWQPKWRPADGLVRATEATESYLATQRLRSRPYSVTALQHFSACPYRFLLAAIHRLEPRRQAAALVQLDPLTRGRMFHHVQAETLRTLHDAGRIPSALERVEEAQFVLDATLDRLAAVYRDDLAPAIPRIWEDEVASMRGDLRLWLRVLASRSGEWLPRAFEFSFGLGAASVPPPAGEVAASDGAERRETGTGLRSVGAPATLPGGWLLRGAVDLVEERVADLALRVTDHKTGADRTYDGLLVGNGEVLQPALYALALEALQEKPVVEGRLFFCTARGRFRERSVPLGDFTRKYAGDVLQVVDGSVAMGFLPPAPREGACTFCDFRPVCGPHEEIRSRRKTEPSLAHLEYVRSLP